MGQPVDVVLSWYAAVPESTQALFQRPTRFIQLPTPDGQHYGDQLLYAPSAERPWAIGGWPHPLQAIFRRYGIDHPLRVAVFGFSQGCQGVGALLGSEDVGYIEHTLAFDGIHCSWYPGQGPNTGRSNINPSCLSKWIGRAAFCAKERVAIGGLPPAPHFSTYTHSQIIPPDFPATGDTAREIMAALWTDPPEPSLPAGLVGFDIDPPWKTFRTPGLEYSRDTNLYAAGENGALILGYKNMDPGGVADHIYQGSVVLKRCLDLLLVPRWNEVDPLAPTCAAAGSLSGPQCNPWAPAVIPTGYMDDPQDASIDWLKYVPELRDKPVLSGLGAALSLAVGAGVGVAGWKAWQYYKRRRGARKA